MPATALSARPDRPKASDFIAPPAPPNATKPPAAAGLPRPFRQPPAQPSRFPHHGARGSAVETTGPVRGRQPQAAGSPRDAAVPRDAAHLRGAAVPLEATRPRNTARPRNAAARGTASQRSGPAPATADDEILFQKFFKSVGPRTYAAQVKRVRNGNHVLVLTEGKRDDRTGDVRKARVFVYGEDFVEFFRLMKSAAEFVRDNPLPEEFKRRRDRFWATRGGTRPPTAPPAAAKPAVTAAGPARSDTRA